MSSYACCFCCVCIVCLCRHVRGSGVAAAKKQRQLYPPRLPSRVLLCGLLGLARPLLPAQPRHCAIASTAFQCPLCSRLLSPFQRKRRVMGGQGRREPESRCGFCPEHLNFQFSTFAISLFNFCDFNFLLLRLHFSTLPNRGQLQVSILSVSPAIQESVIT